MKYCLVKTKQVSGFVLVGLQPAARRTEMPSKKGKGKAAKEPANLKSPATESISDYIQKAWREDGAAPFDKVKIATQAAARGERTSAVMYATNTTLKLDNRSSSIVQRSSSPPYGTSSSSSSSPSSSSSSSSISFNNSSSSSCTSNSLFALPTSKGKVLSKRRKVESSPKMIQAVSPSSTFFSPRYRTSNASGSDVSQPEPTLSRPKSSKKPSKAAPLAERSAVAAASLLLPKPTADSALRAFHKRKLLGDMQFIAGHCYFEALARSFVLTSGMGAMLGARLVRSLFSRFYGGAMAALWPLLTSLGESEREKMPGYSTAVAQVEDRTERRAARAEHRKERLVHWALKPGGFFSARAQMMGSIDCQKVTSDLWEYNIEFDSNALPHITMRALAIDGKVTYNLNQHPKPTNNRIEEPKWLLYLGQ